MILYHERRATTQGDKRVEVQVEEVTTTKGARYVVFTFLAPALSQPELKQEWLFHERERAVRASLAWFDAQVKELFADVPQEQILPQGAREAVTVSNRASAECERIGDNMGQPPQPEKVEYFAQFWLNWDGQWRNSWPGETIQELRDYIKTRTGNWRIIKCTTCGENVTEEVIDA